jgi:hypothetical protein
MAMNEGRPAYVILCHKRPDLLARLVGALGPAPVAVHVDRKVEIEPFRAALKSRRDVAFLPRHVCHWGLFGHVAASLDGLRWFLSTDATHAALLTVQCYPLVSQERVREHLGALRERSQMRMVPFPIESWGPTGGYIRIDRHYFHAGGSKPRSIRLLPRDMPHDLHPHGGQSYWCLSRKHAAYVLDYLAQRPRVPGFYRTTLVPDEMMFQTIMANSPFASEVVQEAFNYSAFLPGRPNPNILRSAADIAGARATGALFARKFEIHEALDQVDALIRSDRLVSS